MCVWDRAYKDLTKKKQAWAELAHIFKKDVDSLKRLWKNLKDNFGKCLKNRIKMTRSGAAAETLPKCKLFDQLYFIKDTVANRPTISNIPQESQETPDVAFAHSIIPILKLLPAKKNRLVKVEIQQLLIKYEFEE